MGLAIPYPGGVFALAPANNYVAFLTTLAVQARASDPQFLARIVLQNVLYGSYYWISQYGSDPPVIIATGQQTSLGADIILDAMPGYTSPMTLEVRVRLSDETNGHYLESLTYASHSRAGTRVYVVQIADPTF